MRPVLRLLSVLTILVGLTLFASPAEAATGVVATPATDLVDGQVVAVAASGFTPGAMVAWCQAVRTPTPSQNDCGTAVTVVAADDQGNVAGTQRVQRLMSVPSTGAIDCSETTSHCVIGAADITAIAATAAYADLQFRAAPPAVLPGSATSAEGGSGAHDLGIGVNLSKPSVDPVTVEWTTIFATGAPDFQADPATDYTPASGTVTFAPGVTTQSVDVSVNGDPNVEPDEYIVVSFRNPTNAVMGGFWGLGFGIIANDDQPPTVLPGGATIAEGSIGTHDITIPVTLSAVSADVVTVEWTTVFAAGAPDFQADPVSDYTPASGTVTFAPGQTTQSVVVSINGDTTVEPDEYLVVSFHTPTKAIMGGFYGLGFGILQNDD